MHDNQLKDLMGWPDVETASSVVRCVKQTYTLTTPSPGTPDNWDAIIANWPWLEQVQFGKKACVNNSFGATTDQVPLGGVQVWTPLTGQDLDLAGTPSPLSVTLDPSYIQGASRIVGMGIEVQNTTADIYKQGQVLVWRQPSAAGGSATFNATDGAAGPKPFLGHMQRRPPANTAQEMLIPGTRQWRAEQGAYIVGTFVGQDNPPLYTSYDLPVVYDDAIVEDNTTDNTSGSATYNSRDLWLPTQSVPLTPGIGFVAPCMKMNPMHMSGMHFTGLSAQSSLALTVNFYVESFPGPAEQNILVLATPSAEYDPVALEIFSHALSSLPVGVTAGENGFGDWFADVVRQVSAYVYPVAKAFGFNTVAEATRGVNKAARSNQSYMAAQTPQTQARIAASPSKKKKPKKRTAAQPPPVAKARPRKAGK